MPNQTSLTFMGVMENNKYSYCIKEGRVSYLIFRSDSVNASSMQFHFPKKHLLAFQTTLKAPIWMSSFCSNTVNAKSTLKTCSLTFGKEGWCPQGKSPSFIFLGELFFWQIVKEGSVNRSKHGDYFVTLGRQSPPHWYK